MDNILNLLQIQRIAETFFGLRFLHYLRRFQTSPAQRQRSLHIHFWLCISYIHYHTVSADEQQYSGRLSNNDFPLLILIVPGNFNVQIIKSIIGKTILYSAVSLHSGCSFVMCLNHVLLKYYYLLEVMFFLGKNENIVVIKSS